jgi:hypothetical protein
VTLNDDVYEGCGGPLERLPAATGTRPANTAIGFAPGSGRLLDRG